MWLALSGTLLSGLLAGTLSAQTTGKPDDFVSGRPSTASRELRDILHERDELRRDLEETEAMNAGLNAEGDAASA